MALHGYDVALELGRSALNKVLEKLEQSPLWVGTFKGDQTQTDPLGFKARIQYEVRLSRIRVRPAEEQEEKPVSSIDLLIDVAGSALVQFWIDDQLMFDHPITLDGVLSTAVHFELIKPDGQFRLVITFRNALVQYVQLVGLPEDIRRMLVNGLQFLMENELRARQQDLPLTGLLKLSGAPQGRLEALLLKTHFYRTIPDDSAVGLGVIFEPGAAPETARAPLDLHRQDNQDLVATLDQGYVNRLIANALHESAEPNAGGAVFGEALASYPFKVRSASIATDSGRLDVTIRAGSRQTEFSVQARLIPEVKDGRLTLRVADVRCDAPTWKGALVKVALNVVAWVVINLINRVIADRIAVPIRDIEEQASRVVIDGNLFQDFPEGLVIKASPRTARFDHGKLMLGYELFITLRA